eukprot:357618-Chlamydomonas_euryale.AAC.2
MEMGVVQQAPSSLFARHAHLHTPAAWHVHRPPLGFRQLLRPSEEHLVDGALLLLAGAGRRRGRAGGAVAVRTVAAAAATAATEAVSFSGALAAALAGGGGGLLAVIHRLLAALHRVPRNLLLQSRLFLQAHLLGGAPFDALLVERHGGAAVARVGPVARGRNPNASSGWLSAVFRVATHSGRKC